MAYSQNGDFINSLIFIIRPLKDVFKYVFKVGNSHVFLKIFILEQYIISQFNFRLDIREGTNSIHLLVGLRLLRRLITFHRVLNINKINNMQYRI
jgi:hypothetical protein